MLPEKPEPVLLAKILTKVACLSRIHASQLVLCLLAVSEVADLPLLFVPAF
jgi:hypothetical protein